MLFGKPLAVKLLTSLCKHDNTESNAVRLRRLIGLKNLVEYKDGLFTQSEAYTLEKHARRFLDWVNSILPRQ